MADKSKGTPVSGIMPHGPNVDERLGNYEYNKSRCEKSTKVIRAL